MRRGGKSARSRDGAARDAQGSNVADPVGVDAGVVGCFVHEGADGVVAAQVAPDLLQDEVRGFGAQHGAWPSLMGFQFVEDALDLPTLRVRDRQVRGGHVVRVQDRGDQLVAVLVVPAVVEGVVDHPDRGGARRDA